MKNKLRKLKSVLAITEKVSGLLANITQASHPMAWVGVGMNLTSHIVDLIPEDLELGRAWKHVDRATGDAVCQVLANAGVGTLKAEKNMISYFEHEGALWGVEESKAFGPFGEAEHLPALVWESLGQYVQMDVDFNRLNFSIQTTLIRDEPPPAYEMTDTGRRILDEIQAKRAHGDPVGVLLHGPAGTGKTSILCAVAKELNAKVLIGSTFDAFRTLNMVKVLKPDMVIFEDICRTPVTETTLKTFANLVDFGVLVMATANHPEAIDRALLRPGRLGMHYHIEHADPSTIRGMLSSAEIEIQDEWSRFETLTLAELVSWISDHRSLGRARAWEILEKRKTDFRKWSGEEDKDEEGPEAAPSEAPSTPQTKVST